MKVALVHDYLKEFGGAERVLLALSEIFPDAPIYTSFCKKNSNAEKKFRGKKIIQSWVRFIPFFSNFLYSPLRFLAPLIWNSFDFKKYDLIISSASWYITKGFKKKGKNTKEVCYCHTPPRWLYGYKTSIEFQKYWPIKIYAAVVSHFMRMYDFYAAQRVDYFIANSKNVKERINKFYRRDSEVIYPPVELSDIKDNVKKKDYYLVTSRIVGGKNLELAVKAALKLKLNLKVIGAPSGFSMEYKRLKKLSRGKIEFLGFVTDNNLSKYYSEAKAFFALAEDEDFGITPVEAMLCGTPVIAYHGGGYLESVVDGKTGVFFKEQSVKSLTDAILKFEKMKFDSSEIKKHAKKFSKERFQKEISDFVKKIYA